MDVIVRLFAQLRERAGTGEVTLQLPDGARVADALAEVAELTAGVTVVMAVNHEYADEARVLSSGDELALIPPVSGGAAESAAANLPTDIHVRITAEPLALDPLLARVGDPRAGAVVSFAGVTREIPALQYEAYAEMAHAEITAIAARAIAGHGLCAAAVEHRTGTVALGEPSVLIAVSAPHRAEAFAGAREIIDEIKANAPIWKREGEEWVSGTAPRPRAPVVARTRPAGAEPTR